MSSGWVIANIDRAGGHIVIVGVLLGIAAVGGLIYGLIRVVAKRRTGPTSPDRGPESDPAPDARDRNRGT